MTTAHVLMLVLVVVTSAGSAEAGAASSSAWHDYAQNTSLDLEPAAISDAPVIVAITITNLTERSVVITWSTDLASDSQVQFGLTSDYGNVASDAPLVISHRVVIEGLNPGSTYFFCVLSQEAGGGLTSSTGYQFTTSGDIRAPVITEVSATSDTPYSAWILWRTSEGCSSQVAYGLTPAMGKTSHLDNRLVVMHTVRLIGLAPATTYHFRVFGEDATGNSATSPTAVITTRSASDSDDGPGGGNAGGGADSNGSCNSGALSLLMVMALFCGFNLRRGTPVPTAGAARPCCAGSPANR